MTLLVHCKASKLASGIVDTVGNVQEFAYGAGEYSEGQRKNAMKNTL